MRLHPSFYFLARLGKAAITLIVSEDIEFGEAFADCSQPFIFFITKS